MFKHKLFLKSPCELYVPVNPEFKDGSMMISKKKMETVPALH